MKRLTSALALILYLIFLPTLLVSAGIKPGDKCTKLNSTKTVAGYKYTCAKSGKKLVWSKGVKVAVPSGGASGSKGSTTSTVTTPVSALRVYSKFIPSSYLKNSPVPLVVLLHGYGSNGVQIESYMGFRAVAEKNRFILVYPDGTVDPTGRRFWSATDACCNFFKEFFPEAEDDTYLQSVITEMETNYSIDPKRIFFVGHSNGGFMSYRMACKHSDRIAAIASLAGATFFKSTDCAAQNPVTVLQVHGTDDKTILFDGGNLFGTLYPSANASAVQWAKFNQCAQNALSLPTKLDLELNIVGNETSITSWTNCRNSSEVELWTMDKASHIPALNSTFANEIWNFFAAHPKP